MKRIRKLFLLMRRASSSRNIIGQLIDLISHKLLINIGPRDYYYFEFYKRELTWEKKSRYASSRTSRYWIFENNPFKYQILFTDKYVQKSLLTGLKLPTPAMLAFVGAGGAVSSLQDFQTVIERAPDEFVLKPVSACGGRGFRKLRKSQGVLLEGGDPIQLDDLWQSLQPDMNRGILVEETAHNIEPIRRMNSSSLNTFRVITFKFPDAGWVPICSYLKVGRKNSAVDNRHDGGLLVRIDSDGTTGMAVDPKTRLNHSHHPETGTALAGIHIDGFQDVIDLAVKASAPFSQMGVLGWDIALTPGGPKIIEVNASPAVDFLQVAYGGLVTDEMARVLTPRNMLSRYPKTYMYPNHLLDRKGRV